MVGFGGVWWGRVGFFSSAEPAQLLRFGGDVFFLMGFGRV
jgi:hypothetical protein